MHKEELVFLHLTLFHVKRFLEEAGLSNGYFREYEDMGVQPVHIHKSKNDHKKAIFLLCKGLNEMLGERSHSDLLANPRLREVISLVEVQVH
ncbi:UPF0058 family protein [Geoglobus acetivorans]|uniref:UPF0058 family protein n=1 Tax=Geoglobus acetivorans TaxID=565033 RepID=A0ABZ3H413_GEOAI|nr:UPF0058 family protein [Geoglobus acetivorans]